jgi:hypothetical protein
MCFVMFTFAIIAILHFDFGIIETAALAVICTRFKSKSKQRLNSKHTRECLVCMLIRLFCLCLRQVLNRIHAFQEMPAYILRV